MLFLTVLFFQILAFSLLSLQHCQESLKKIAPTWMNVSLAMKKDPETDKAFGWVLEM
jgi:hypothetical protein